MKGGHRGDKAVAEISASVFAAERERVVAEPIPQQGAVR